MMTFMFVGLRYVNRDGQTILQYGSQQKLLKADPTTGEVWVAAGAPPEWHDVPIAEE